ncbi:MAG: DUF1501 domain-containing protein [Gemmataceae bacterium]
MLTVLGSRHGVTRRQALTAGTIAALGGLSLPRLLAAEEASPGRKAKHVICLYLLGGAATQDMWDLKPSAPADVRGEFKPIATSAPGVSICEHLPRLAKWMHKAAVLRSVTHKAGCHNPIPGYTGAELTPPDIISAKESYPPSMGSVCEYLRQNGPGRNRELPDYVYMPCYLGWGQAIRRPGPYAGFLGKQYDALYTECTPSLDPGAVCGPGQPQFVRGQPRLPDAPAGEITLDRLRGRKSLLSQFESQLAAAEANQGVYDRQQRRAFQLLTSPSVRAAFDLDREPAALRDAYGRTMFGSSALVARRLVEAGVRFVNVTWDIYWDRFTIDYDGWDTHTKNFEILKRWNLPQFDQTLSALLADLDARGLLDETLILVTSEMGRTPRVNGNAGRDHWTYCYGNLLAGAGIRGGSVCGASDAQAAFVKDRPVRPADVVATVYHCLGIDPDLPVYDRTNRPVPAAQGGEPVREILA